MDALLPPSFATYNYTTLSGKIQQVYKSQQIFPEKR